MIEGDNSKAREMLKQGTYFDTAFEWYAGKYLYPMSARSAALIIIAGILYSFWTLLDLNFKEFQQKFFPFPIYAVDQTLYAPSIKPLAIKKEPMDVSVSRYLAQKYVEYREGYRSQDFSDEFNRQTLTDKIKAISSRKMFKQYEDFINPDVNPNSPLIIYKNQTQRIITITKTEMKGEVNRPDFAVIYYTATERNSSGESQSNWVAEVDFMMTDIAKVSSKQIPFDFKVTQYTTKKL